MDSSHDRVRQTEELSSEDADLKEDTSSQYNGVIGSKLISLKRKSDFANVFEHGQTKSSGIIVLKVARNNLPNNRFGFSINKRVGNAVTRNQIKRRFRNIIRNIELKQGWDVVLIARVKLNTANYTEMKIGLTGLCKNFGLLIESGSSKKKVE
ncbi:MAG TPA: ribonuclease P protein component [Dehalococcoidia bacterium]|jgi:ribonuclease P protein component|nr:ribonuclease P protein component [Dehalococcoidia bacterium]